MHLAGRASMEVRESLLPRSSYSTFDLGRDIVNFLSFRSLLSLVSFILFNFTCILQEWMFQFRGDSHVTTAQESFLKTRNVKTRNVASTMSFVVYAEPQVKIKQIHNSVIQALAFITVSGLLYLLSISILTTCSPQKPQLLPRKTVYITDTQWHWLGHLCCQCQA